MQPGTEHLTDDQRMQLAAAEALFADPQIEADPEEYGAVGVGVTHHSTDRRARDV